MNNYNLDFMDESASYNKNFSHEVFNHLKIEFVLAKKTVYYSNSEIEQFF